MGVFTQQDHGHFPTRVSPSILFLKPLLRLCRVISPLSCADRQAQSASCTDRGTLMFCAQPGSAIRAARPCEEPACHPGDLEALSRWHPRAQGGTRTRWSGFLHGPSWLTEPARPALLVGSWFPVAHFHVSEEISCTSPHCVPPCRPARSRAALRPQDPPSALSCALLSLELVATLYPCMSL